MYLSYRLARNAKLRSYLPKITVSILAVSFISTFPQLGFFFLIVGFFFFKYLSFPFYSVYYDTFDALGFRRIHHGIRFLTLNVTSIPYSWEATGPPILEIGRNKFNTPAHAFGWEDYIHEFSIVFMFFLLVNFLGALFGYWISKKQRIRFFSSMWWRVLWGFFGLACLGLFTMPSILQVMDERTETALLGFGIILLETIIVPWLMEPTPARKRLLDYVTR